jgi:hypothetical protein
MKFGEEGFRVIPPTFVVPLHILVLAYGRHCTTVVARLVRVSS